MNAPTVYTRAAIDLLLIVTIVAVVSLSGIITAIRIGILPANFFPALHVRVAEANTWDTHIGRLHGGGSEGNSWCDPGYWLVTKHRDVGNEYNALWLTCQN